MVAPVLVPPPPIVAARVRPVIIRPPEVNAAYDFALIGFILTFLMTIPWLLLSAIIGGFGLAAYLGYVILPPPIPPFLSGIPFLGPYLIFLTFVLPPSFLIYLALGGGGLLLVLLFLLILWWTTVRRIVIGLYWRARNGCLFWGILFILPSLFVLFAPTIIAGVIIGIIPAFFFLLAYGKLGEVIAKYGPVAILGEAVPGAPFAGPPPPPPPMPVAGPAAMGPPVPAPALPSGPMPSLEPMTGVAPRIPLCPGCGRELYYSQNHRRWYCMTCDNPTPTPGLPRPRGLDP